MNRLYDDAELTPEEESYLKGEQVEIKETPAAVVTDPPDIVEPDPGMAPNPQEVAQDELKGKQTPSDDNEDDEDDSHIIVDPATGRHKDTRTGRFVKLVPHQALHKERETHKQTKSALENERMRFARADERMNTLLALAQNMPKGDKQDAPKSPMEEPDIDPTADIVGALDQQKRRNAYLNQQISTDRQSRETAAAETQVVNAYKSDAMKFMQTEPAFAEAYKFLVNSRLKQMETVGISDVNECKRQFAMEERALVQQAFSQNKSPAQILWNLAVASGFQKSAAPAPGKTNGGHQQNVQKLQQQQQRGMAASASLSGTGSAGGALTIAKIADMDDEDFAKLVDSGQFRKIMYG
ncbi:MAG: hypothetical protein ACKVP3_23610 [Hyphomicrobiaceae bacterium]